MRSSLRVIRALSIAVFPIIVAAFIAIYNRDPQRYVSLLREDGLIEWLSFLCLAVSGLLALEIFIQLRQREQRMHWFFLVFGLFCILIALEEISWGQRVFQVESPDFFLGRSDQQEINVHNVLQQQLDFKTKDVAALVLFAYGVILALLAVNSHVSRLLKRVGVVVPPLFLMGGFLIATALMADVPTGWEEELGEFLFALSFLLFMIYELYKRSPTDLLQPFHLPRLDESFSQPRLDRITIVLLTGLAFVLRIWSVGSKGLRLEEASYLAIAELPIFGDTQLLAHIFPEYSVVWVTLLAGWSGFVGQSEAWLRLLPALLGTLSVPLLWLLLKSVKPSDWSLRTLATLLLAITPSAIFFAQDITAAGMLMTFTLLSLLVAIQLAARPSNLRLALYVAVNWLMLSLHPYTVTILIAEMLYFGGILLVERRNARRKWQWYGAGLLLSFAPLALASLLSINWWNAGVSDSADAVNNEAGVTEQFKTIWLALLLGPLQTYHRISQSTLLLLPYVLLGVWVTVREGFATSTIAETYRRAWGWLLLGAGLLPFVPVLAAPGSFSRDTLIIAVPSLLTLTSVGILFFWRRVRLLGLASAILVIAVLLVGLLHYYGDAQKSTYRELVEVLNEQLRPTDSVILLNPKQIPLADYYLNADADVVSLPAVENQLGWVSELTPVIPEVADDQLQQSLQQHQRLWLILHAKDAVDPGDFIRRYLTAVSHFNGCREWLDVELCQFISPHYWQPIVSHSIDAVYNGELALQSISVGAMNDPAQDTTVLLATLDWLSLQRPSVDYTVSLRLVDEAGNLVAQRDSMPIGYLLPPTTWQAGDKKPGYMALELTEDVPSGEYELQMVVYNPNDQSPFRAQNAGGAEQEGPLSLASVVVSDHVELSGTD